MKTKLSKYLLLISLLLISLFCCNPAFCRQSWSSWVKELRQEAIADGIRPQLFDSVFHNMQPSRKHIHLDRTQPERRLTYYKYRNTRGDAYRIRLGRKYYRKHRDLINRIGQQYGVDPCIIVALWGLESSYGHYMGNFNVIRSLATLSYDSRRSAFFRKELLLALHMLNDGVIEYHEFKGEWAGASGQPQFLPSSWYKYAVDHNYDGLKDIWKTYPDIFASIANYLSTNGWQSHQPIAIPVTLPRHFDRSLMGLKKQQRTVQQWFSLGVRPKSTAILPNNYNLYASLVQPYGGPVFMAFNNYRTLLSWNYSLFYAGTVNYVAQKICQR